MDQTPKKNDGQYQIKLLILGDQAVGKSSLMTRYTEEIFNLNIMGTAGIDLKKKNVIIGEDNIKVMIYDTAGHERFRLIAKTQYKGSKGIILVYDITDKKTFDSVSYWMNHITENAETGVEILLVGNKIDKTDERLVSTQEGIDLAAKYNVPFMETSAKTNENVDLSFMTIITNAYNKEKKNNAITTTEVINSPDSKKVKTKSKCCN